MCTWQLVCVVHLLLWCLFGNVCMLANREHLQLSWPILCYPLIGSTIMRCNPFQHFRISSIKLVSWCLQNSSHYSLLFLSNSSRSWSKCFNHFDWHCELKESSPVIIWVWFKSGRVQKAIVAPDKSLTAIYFCIKGCSHPKLI